ncbi:MAG: transporter substrate-binding protein [Marmoricola sp.]|jgi:polar amino acid transport system substrate-binding protein|nr:transporter substrate-binding protein [Marmoricola sp.]
MQRSKTVISVVALGLMALAGCGSNSLDTSDKKGADVKTSVDKNAAALVPKAIKDKGTLTIGTDASYAPSEFLAGDGKTIEGFDIDLFKAVAGVLGLKVDFKPASFDTIITGVTSQKYDAGVSSFTINDERKKQVDMVSYFSAGTQWAAAKGKGADIDVDKPCGLGIAVQKGTVQQEEDLPAKEKACQAAGKPIKIFVYDKQDQATAAVANGKADAMLADSPVVAYAVDQSKGKLEAAGDIYDAAPYGYVIAKQNEGLANAIVKALDKLKSDGGYEKALKGWGVEAGAVDSFAVNP